jgi:FkbM family methyltransferase
MRLPPSVRRFSDPFVANLRVPILGGVNRGLWWSLGSAGSGYATGRRAAEQMHLLASLIRPDDVVYDIGAHHGYVTLAAARTVGEQGAVHAFEPSRTNRARLERHVIWNLFTNVTVHPFALADYDGESSFGGSGTSKMFALGGGAEVVQVRSAESLVRSLGIRRPSFVKIDVEGAEADTLRGLLPVLTPSSRLCIAVHTREADRACMSLLAAAGYSCVASQALARNRAGGVWHSDPDLYCAGPDHAHLAADRASLEAAGF